MIQRLLVSFFLLIYFSPNAQENDTLHFKWLGDSIRGLYLEKAAMIIPITFKNDTTSYYFQFDTGANTSSIYTGVEHKVNSTVPKLLSGSLRTNIGLVNFVSISYMSPFEIQGKLILGTIGANVLSDKVLQIDFPNQTLIFSEKADTNTFDFHPIETSFGRPVIELWLNHKRYDFLFDTGSSLFEIWTTKKVWKRTVSKNASITKVSISSWGQLNTVYISPLREKTSLFQCDAIQLHNISYSSNKNYAKTFKQAGINGVIGNKPFLMQVIVLDISSKRIGIKKCM